MDFISNKKELTFDYANDTELLEKLKRFYTFHGMVPDIIIDGDTIIIRHKDAVFDSTKRDYEKAIVFCNKNQFDKAAPLLRSVVKDCPLYFDAYRILAQIEFYKNELDKAIDLNIEALKIEPTNVNSLLLMGNIYMMKGDNENTEMYYNKILEYHPDDPLALSNIGGFYVQQHKYDEAMGIFKKANESDPSLLNAYHGLALCYYNKRDYQNAFSTCIDGLKKGTNRPQDGDVRSHLQNLTMSVAHKMVDGFDFSIELGIEQKKLSEMTDIPLKIEEDDSLKVHAQFEYYLSRGKDYNRVVYNPNKKYHEHLLMHEFMHMEMYIEASKLGKNLLPYSSKEETESFNKWIEPEMKKLKSILSTPDYLEVRKQIRDGLMLQVVNNPLDLLVEDRIYKNYPHMRPLQLISLVEMDMNNIKAQANVSDSGLPRKVMSLNKIMNIISSFHLKDLYGFDFISQFGASSYEMKKAKDLYEEYEAYRDNYQPGEEYEMMLYFAENLAVDGFFELASEEKFKSGDLISQIVDNLSEDVDDKNQEFREQHKDGENKTETMMMSMYMVDALNYFKGMLKDKVMGIAYEIAFLGVSGIDPHKKGYHVASIPNKEFSGYQLFAYYYVSWAIAMPEKLETLNLPFKKAYSLALQIFNKK